MKTNSNVLKLLDEIKMDIINDNYLIDDCLLSNIPWSKKDLLNELVQTIKIVTDKFRKGPDVYLIEWEDCEHFTSEFLEKVTLFTSYSEKIDEEKEIYSPDYEENQRKKKMKAWKDKDKELLQGALNKMLTQFK